MELREGTLVLRAIEPGDAIVSHRLISDPEIEAAVIGWSGPVSQASQVAWISSIQPTDFRFAIADEGEVVGLAQLHPVDLKNRTANINLKLVPEQRGRGLGSRTVSLLLEYCFNELDCEVVTAGVLDSNVASLALFEKLGFVKDGALRSRVFKNGSRRSIIQYSLLRSEYS